MSYIDEKESVPLMIVKLIAACVITGGAALPFCIVFFIVWFFFWRKK